MQTKTLTGHFKEDDEMNMMHMKIKRTEIYNKYKPKTI